MMTFIEAVKSCFSKENYISWNGRASRSEFWYFYLFGIIASTVLNVAFPVFSGGSFSQQLGYGSYPAGTAVSMTNLLIALVAGIATGIPSLAVTGRRFHDTDRSVWNVFWVFVPLAGVFVYLYVLISAGTEGENRFGPETDTGSHDTL